MPALFLGLLVLVACVVAFQNWRLGLFLCILTGMLQDPIRKVTSESPAYLTLSFLPVYFALLASVWSQTRGTVPLLQYHRRLRIPVILVIMALLASSIQTLAHGLQAAPLALLGIFSYAGSLPAIFLGFYLVRRDCGELERPLVWLALLISLMLVGVPLEYFDVGFAAPVLKTVGFPGSWVRWHSAGKSIEMISGFYRAPEIMGWHALTLVVISIYLIVRSGTIYSPWVLTTLWGLSCVVLSGRRKMLVMAVIYVVVFLTATQGLRRSRMAVSVLIALAGLVLVLGRSLDTRYIDTAESTLPDLSTRVVSEVVEGPTFLIPLVGPFGFGVGVRAQGMQHLMDLEIETPLMEGGFEKIMIELGIFGTFAFSWFLIVLARCLLDCFRISKELRSAETITAALLAFLTANVAGFATGFQVFGDPLIVVMSGLALGVLLSIPRLADRGRFATRRRRSLPPAQGRVSAEPTVPALD